MITIFIQDIDPNLNIAQNNVNRLYHKHNNKLSRLFLIGFVWARNAITSQ